MGAPYGIDLRKKTMILLKKGMSKSQVSALLHISKATIVKERRKERRMVRS